MNDNEPRILFLDEVVRTGDPPPQCPPARWSNPLPSIAEQMGTDPISKLARAIEKLADALSSRTS